MLERLTNDPDFLTEELALSGILTKAFQDAGERVFSQFKSAVAAPFDARRVEAVLESARDEFVNIVQGDTRVEVEGFVAEAVRKGAVEGGALADFLKGVPSVSMVQTATADMVEYFANSYFDDFLAPSFRMKMDAIVAETPPTEPVDGDAVFAAFAGTVAAASAYVGVVANSAISRAFHYSVLKTGQLRGKTGYRWRSHLDERTSDICNEMHGREFWLADAVSLLESSAASFDPKSVKTMTPWPRLEQVKNATNDALRAMGFLVPPAHGRCRSTIVLI